MVKHIPNLVTLGNLACGCLGIMFAFNGDLALGAYMVFLGAAFDFADGFVARALKVSSELGKQLDSLSDDVTFGVLPASLLVLLMSNGNTTEWYLAAPLYVLALATAYRLAKFNISEEQSTSFIGMPSPASGIFFAALTLGVVQQQFPQVLLDALAQPYTLYVLAAVFSYLMISPLPMFAMKVKGYGWKGNEFRYILIVSAVVLTILFKFAGVALTIIAYILLSIIEKTVRK